MIVKVNFYPSVRASSYYLISALFLMLLLSSCGGGGGTTTTTPSTNALLSNLSLSIGSLGQPFQSSLYSYTYTVSFSVTSISVTATAANANSSIVIQGTTVLSGASSQQIALAEGFNTLTIDVTAEDGSTTQTYSIDITRTSAAAFAQNAYLKASDAQTSDIFSSSVAISGDTLVVAAAYEDSSSTGGESDNSVENSGAVYIFTRSAGTWTQQAFLKAPNAETNDRFGASVAIDGDTLVISATLESSSTMGGESNNSVFGSGAVYVFTRSAGAWTQEAFLKASNAGESDFFGHSVAISGDTLVAGAILEDSVVTDSGAVYVFTRSAGVWTQQDFLKASDAGDAEYFGHSVSLDGDTLAVGANRADDEGAAYVFTRSVGVWSEQKKLKASNPQLNSRYFFGNSIAINGDTIVVGSKGEGSSATSSGAITLDSLKSGAAYVFIRDAGNWTEQALLKASTVDADDSFGTSVAIDGDTILVGAVGEDSSSVGDQTDNSANAAGAAYVFSRSAGTWTQQAFLKASNAETNDQFGSSVAISGDILIVGAAGEASSTSGNEMDNSELFAGAVYVWQ